MISPFIYLSINGTWIAFPSFLPMSTKINDVMIVSITPPTMMIASNMGIWRIVTDGMGNIMSMIQPVIDHILKLQPEETMNITSSLLYATSSRALLYTSYDMGMTWNTTSLSSLYSTSCPYNNTDLEQGIIVNAKNSAYIGLASKQCIMIISTINRGLTWNIQLSRNISTSIDTTYLAMTLSENIPDTIYICGTGNFFGKIKRGVTGTFTNLAGGVRTPINCRNMMYDTLSPTPTIYIASDLGLSKFSLTTSTLVDTSLTNTLPSITSILSTMFNPMSMQYITAIQGKPISIGNNMDMFVTNMGATQPSGSVMYDMNHNMMITTSTYLRSIERILSPTANPDITYQTVLKHNNTNDCWMIVSGVVVDMTSLGGNNPFISSCGKDATMMYKASPSLPSLTRYTSGLVTYTLTDIQPHNISTDCWIIVGNHVINATGINVANLCGMVAPDQIAQAIMSQINLPPITLGRYNSNPSLTRPTYSSTFIARHHYKSDCWIIMNQTIVVDITSLLSTNMTLISYCGGFLPFNINTTLIQPSMIMGDLVTPISFTGLSTVSNIHFRPDTYVAMNSQIINQGMVCSIPGFIDADCWILDFINNTMIPMGLGLGYDQYIMGGIHQNVVDPNVMMMISSQQIYTRDIIHGIMRIQSPWTNIPVGMVVQPNDYYHIVVTVSSGSIYRTIDFGQTWTNITTNLTGIVTPVIMMELDTMTTVIMVGTDHGVYLTFVNNLITTTGKWYPLGDSLPQATITSLQYVMDYDILVIGTMGRGIYTLPGVMSNVMTMKAIVPLIIPTTATPTTGVPTNAPTPTPVGVIPTDAPTTPVPTTTPSSSTGINGPINTTNPSPSTTKPFTIYGFELKFAIPIIAGAVIIIAVVLILLWKWCRSKGSSLKEMRQSMDFGSTLPPGFAPADTHPDYAQSLKFSDGVHAKNLPTQSQRHTITMFDEVNSDAIPLGTRPVKSSMDSEDNLAAARQHRLTIQSGGWYEPMGISTSSPLSSTPSTPASMKPLPPPPMTPPPPVQKNIPPPPMTPPQQHTTIGYDPNYVPPQQQYY